MKFPLWLFASSFFRLDNEEDVGRSLLDGGGSGLVVALRVCGTDGGHTETTHL